MQQPDNPTVIAVCGLLTLIVKGFLDFQRTRRLTSRFNEGTTELASKIEANTDLSVKAFDSANHINEKIAQLAASTNRVAVLSMQEVLSRLSVIEELLSDCRERTSASTKADKLDK